MFNTRNRGDKNAAPVATAVVAFTYKPPKAETSEDLATFAEAFNRLGSLIDFLEMPYDEIASLI